MGHALFGQPVGQDQQLAGHGAEGPGQITDTALGLDPSHTGHYGRLVDVESGTTAVDRLHGRLRKRDPTSEDIERGQVSHDPDQLNDGTVARAT
jgi:hypothetical protein